MFGFRVPPTSSVPVVLAIALAGALAPGRATAQAAPSAERAPLQRPTIPEPAAPTSTSSSSSSSSSSEPAAPITPASEPAAPSSPASEPAAPTSSASEHAPPVLPPHLAPVSDTSPTSIELGPAVLAPPSCPCDELDWMCRQDHEPACRNGAPQSEAVPTADPFSAWAPVEGRASRTPRSTPTERDRGPDLDPRGVALQFGVGIGGCNQDFCEENKLSMLGRVGVGYRLPRIAFMASTMLGGGPKLDGPGGVLFTETDFGIDVFFLRNAVVDPFIGAGVGYMRVVVTHSDHSFTDGGVPTIRDTSYYSRGAARVGAGVPFRVGRGWTMGPRFDYTWGFLGERCMRRHVSCTDTRELLDRAGTREGRRRERADHPQPWSLMLEFRRQF